MYLTLPAKRIITIRAFITLSAFLFTIADFAVRAQAVTGIITDYQSYWKTTAANVNPIKPKNSHNVLAFTYNGTQYSTGVNDALLSQHGEVYTQGDFWSLPVAGFSSAPTSNTKVGLGEMYDGVHNGASNPAPSNDLTSYLTDGIKGLNIGTCIANLPAGTISFFVSNIKPEHIGDGIPDILVTQVADPSNSTDRYSFVNANGQLVGHEKNISFNSIAPVGNWTADFYEASSNPMILTSGFTNTDRPMRLWAADLSELGITVNNYQQIARFVINLSGNSDVAFVAYNTRTINITNVLPVKLSLFTARTISSGTALNWQTANENQADFFQVERSTNGQDFEAIAKVTAAGNSTVTNSYEYTDKQPVNGANYYRLKIVDRNGTFQYSQVISVHVKTAGSLRIYPNPASGQVNLEHPRSNGQEQLLIQNATGVIVGTRALAPASGKTTVQIGNLPAGVYYLVLVSENAKQAIPFTIR